MPLKGTLRTWNDDRGFGFIVPADGGRKLFVHISAFPRGAPRPSVGESVLYEAGYGKDGRARAIRVYRGAHRRASPAQRLHARSGRGFEAKRRQKPFSLVTLGIVLLLGTGGYVFFADHDLRVKGPAWFSELSSRPAALKEPDPAFSCDGRIHCSEMNSCREAEFFIKNCPGTRMDGDHDGIPCEQQWCTGFFAD